METLVFALLCFEAFGSVLILLASVAALVLCLVLKLLDGIVLLYLSVRQPRSSVEKGEPRYDSHLLKRAGQW